MESNHVNYQRKGELENIEYYMEDLNITMKQVANNTLTTTDRRRLITNGQCNIKENTYVTDENRDAIKKREALNRANRVYKDEEEREMKFDLYLTQK